MDTNTSLVENKLDASKLNSSVRDNDSVTTLKDIGVQIKKKVKIMKPRRHDVEYAEG